MQALTSTNANNQYTVVDGQTISHDANGNQVAQGPVSYQWDARNRLVGITGPGTTASFTYDALGRRASKTTNGQTQAYQYDGADIIRDANAEYVQGPGIDNVLDRKDTATGNNEYYLKDHLGSTIALTDQSGSITTQYAYSPFGQVAKTGANSNNYFEYTGRENDGTGLYFYRARYYSPQQKRFIAEDPLGFGGGDTNLQAYVGNNPISLTDPLGLKPGDRFKTPEFAAKDALNYINPSSKAFNREYGGLIYYHKPEGCEERGGGKGGYYANSPVQGTESGVKPFKSKIPYLQAISGVTVVVGDYHTHGDYSLEDPKTGKISRTSDPKRDSFDSDNFSQADKNNINSNVERTGILTYKGYLGTPSGRLLQYNPSTGVLPLK